MGKGNVNFSRVPSQACFIHVHTLKKFGAFYFLKNRWIKCAPSVFSQNMSLVNFLKQPGLLKKFKKEKRHGFQET